jgi:hypothetical protein
VRLTRLPRDGAEASGRIVVALDELSTPLPGLRTGRQE